MSENSSDDTTQKTIAKTLWSETLIDLLVIALQNKQSDKKVTELLRELKQRNFKNDYIISKIGKTLGASEENRVRILLAKNR